MLNPGTPKTLPVQWRAEAASARFNGNEIVARFSERHADELEARDREDQLREVTLREAVGLSGFSYSALEKRVRSGKTPNAGTKNRPRIRVGDLPRKGTVGTTTDDGPDLAGRILARSG